MKIQKHLFATILWIGINFVSYTSFAQIKSYQFEQIDSLQNIEKRNVVIFIHTDWCKYCQAMRNTTFKNQKIVKILNESFYMIDFDAESPKSILFNAHIFKYNPTGSNTGIHELVEQLATIDRKISYPTICFLNPKYEIIFQYNQFINTKDFEALLKKLK